MAGQEDLTGLIPHRPPFLWVDRVLEADDVRIITEKQIDQDLPLFSGHYPGHPILPGVLLCEALFQSGAILMALRQRSVSQEHEGLPLVTRILGARFKKPVSPGSRLHMTVTLKESAANAFYFHGIARVGDSVVATVDFACMLQKPPP